MNVPMPPAPVFACPVCGEPLLRQDRMLRCASAHSFDVAREGYVNLLLPQHRRSRDPGDNPAMITARRAFLEAGHYAPVAEALASAVAAHMGTGGLVIDAGCGEGYYLRRMRAAVHDAGAQDVRFCGIDISRHGVRLAAKRDPAGHYAVASCYRLPFPDESADVIVSHFSPVSAAEFARVLKPGGRVITGGPGEHHLYALKSLVYAAPARHAPGPQPLSAAAGFAPLASHRIRYGLRLNDPQDIAALLAMTPFYWSARPETQAAIAALPALETEVDVVTGVYTKLGPEDVESAAS